MKQGSKASKPSDGVSFSAFEKSCFTVGGLRINDDHTDKPSALTLGVIEESEEGIGLNGPFESVEEMLRALKDDNDE